jgi:nucleoside phosphorylase
VTPHRLRLVFLAVTLSVHACAKSEDATPRIAVFTAMPSELAPLLVQASIEETMVIDGHTFRTATLGGEKVVLAQTQIGIVNATMTSHTLLSHFNITGVVFSGVAGSMFPIADVAVPESWLHEDGTTHHSNAAWLDLARGLANPGAVLFDHGATVPATGQVVCFPYMPTLHFGGVGQSSDTSGSMAAMCQKEGDDVFGCDTKTAPPAVAPTECDGMVAVMTSTVTIDSTTHVTKDMETAAVAAEAEARGLPFIGFRAVSDGSPDPLMLHGWTAQFFAYYRLSAHNAAAAAIAFLERLEKK